ncbi:MAG: hypothetical protein PHR77_15245 [Kiritimatiellae bacterium]|nr:hypothetical protein [Kiritimatiellia bacterium]MDD5523443.1 hypothetical protein [Kiritimatiellia bacterium]
MLQPIPVKPETDARAKWRAEGAEREQHHDYRKANPNPQHGSLVCQSHLFPDPERPF